MESAKISWFAKNKFKIWLVLIGLFVYFNSLFNGFVWDDDFQILGNSFVQRGDLFYYFNHTIGPYYRPLMFFFYTLLFQLFQANSFFYHFFQVSIHICNALLIFVLFLHFSKHKLISFMLSLLFLIHPMNTEPVDYIANLQDVLYVFFGLSALLVIIKTPFKQYSNLITFILLFLSMLSKETGLLFIIICSLYVILFKRKSAFRLVPFYIASFILYLIFRTALVGPVDTHKFNAIPDNLIIAATPLEKLQTVPGILYYYLSTFILPLDLNGQYWYVKSINFSNFYFPLFIDLLFLMTLLVFGLFLQKRHKELAIKYWFFFSWFILGAILLFHILPLSKTASIRWFYFPMIGLLGMALSLLLFQIQKKISFSTLKGTSIIFIIFLIYCSFGIRTIIRNADWQNALTLFGPSIASMNEVADVQYNYGTALSNARRFDEASIHLKKAATLSPKSYQAWHNLGIVYLHINKIKYAKTCFSKAYKLKPELSSSYLALIYISLVENKPKEAKKMADFATKTWPEDPITWRMLGLAEYNLGDTTNAQIHLNKSFSMYPNAVTQYYLNQLQLNQPIEIKEL